MEWKATNAAALFFIVWRGPRHDQRVGWESSCGIVSQHSLPTCPTSPGWMNPPQAIVTHSISKELFVCFHHLIQQNSLAKVSTVHAADFHLRSVPLGSCAVGQSCCFPQVQINPYQRKGMGILQWRTPGFGNPVKEFFLQNWWECLTFCNLHKSVQDCKFHTNIGVLSTTVGLCTWVTAHKFK